MLKVSRGRRTPRSAGDMENRNRRRSTGSAIPEIVSQSPWMRQQLHYARRISTFEEPLLMSGETGTGKDLMARYVHYHSQRRDGPLQIVNCAAVSPELFEAEFFGYVKGAYTGATGEGKGHFQLADEGTLVLDEIGEMDMRFQVKLLRAIENQDIFPVGSQKAVQLNVRIIALTNRDIVAEIDRGRFRPDLFYRLNRLQIQLRPLSERPEDIIPLCHHFLGRSWFSQYPDWRTRIEEGVHERLRQLPFPGNTRDLQNLLVKLLAKTTPEDPCITVASLEEIVGEHYRMPQTTIREENLKIYLKRMEAQKVFETLQATGNNISAAARRLGISRQSLQHRLKRLRQHHNGRLTHI